MSHPHFYRVEMYSNPPNGIHIIHDDIFKYYLLSQHLEKDMQIAGTPCLIKRGSIDLIIDINALSCINPSDRFLYNECMRYWLKHNGLMLVNTYCYDPKLANYPPYAIGKNRMQQWHGKDKCKLLGSRECVVDVGVDCMCHSWVVQK